MTDLQELMALSAEEERLRPTGGAEWSDAHRAYTVAARRFLRSPAFAEMAANAAIGEVVWRYIDRMNDVCPQYDPAEKIIAEFTKAVEPHLFAAIAQRHGRGEG